MTIYGVGIHIFFFECVVRAFEFSSLCSGLLMFLLPSFCMKPFFFLSFRQNMHTIYLVWSVQSILFIDSSGCSSCLIQHSNKKWKIYRDGLGKVAKYRYFTWTLTFLPVRQSTLEESFLLRTCKYTVVHLYIYLINDEIIQIFHIFDGGACAKNGFSLWFSNVSRELILI